MFSNIFSEIRAVDEVMLENVVDSEWPQMTIRKDACALRAG
jgi:hypothetical protein